MILLSGMADHDWQVEAVPLACTSNRTAITADVFSNPTVSFSGLDTLYYDTAHAVTLTGTPPEGTFSGTGISGNTFNPSLADTATTNAVVYNYTDSNGCSGTDTMLVRVLATISSISHIEGISEVSIFPNPNTGDFELTLKSDASAKIDIAVTNMLGQKIYEERNIQVGHSLTKQISLGNVAKGIYQLTLTSNKIRNSYNVVVE